jgi:hypothetical protein
MPKLFDIKLEIVVLRNKIYLDSGGYELKGEPRENRGRPRRCNRGRNLPDPLPEALSLSNGQGGKGQAVG